ncbi:unnamed protein product [Rotaria sp. Silwood1]|nr:unnamed protein product [Rotaria sp. Silwood1]CAF3480777.1 unnamed protein product [Rotaria sp. Silwood1]CAF3540385.1 unnamed protein product [Rotaria sp. Silwood1]CAF4643284.1 unnamed protein product [Rotaria sp. Silwood1]CAF4840573.1 unnamed protein product [Rotaria sp. Silwood1]
MVERLIILKNNSLDSEDGKHSQKTNSQSLITDEDESLSVDSSRQYQENLSKTSEMDLLSPQTSDRRRNLLTINSPSVDSINDRDGSASDNPLTGKLKKKRRATIAPMSDEEFRKIAIKKRPWYTKVDLTKPILCVAILFLICIIWIKRDVLVVRLLTSNARVQHTALAIQQRLNEKDESSQASTMKDSSSASSSQDATANVNNNDDDNNKNNNNVNNNDIINDHASLTDNDEDSPKTTGKGSSSQKINLRTRRNKMSFSKERHKKKHRHLRHKVIDDDNVNDDIVDDDVLEDDIDKAIIKANKMKEPVLPSSIRSSKKHHHNHKHRRSTSSHETNLTKPISSKSHTILPLHNGVAEQIQKLLKSQGGRRDLMKILKKETGLSQGQINRFIQKKDFNVVSLQTFISFLNSLDAKLLLVSK